jgi:hypothetical protein
MSSSNPNIPLNTERYSTGWSKIFKSKKNIKGSKQVNNKIIRDNKGSDKGIVKV